MRSQPLSTLSLPTVALVVALALVGGAALGGDWPQWRGPGGLGVSTDAPLPVTWGPATANVRWSTEIPGDGISSPVAVDDRVFVTTALEDSPLVARMALVTVAVLALAALVSIARAGKPRPRLLTGLSLLFVLLALAMAIRPELFYTVGNPGRVWRATGALALLGLGVGFGWLRPGSRWRLLGALAALAGAAYIAVLMPARPLGPVGWDKRLTFVLPGLVAAVVFVVSYVRRRGPGTAAGRSPAAAAALVALALALFVPPNFLAGLQRAVVCVDLESGEILWQRVVFRAPAEQKWPRSSYATPTAATDGERVFAYFGAGLAALDIEGRPLWVKRFPSYSRHTRYGAGTSPALTGDAVVIVQEHEMYQNAPPGFIAAFDKATGATLWKKTWEDAHDSYNTPLVVPTAGGAQIVTASWQFIGGYDAASGERLWSFPTPQHQVVASMARSGELVAVSGGVYGDQALMILRLAGDPSKAPELVWESNRGIATISSPVFYDGMLFTVTDGGIMTAYDAAGGDQLWKGRLKGEHYASLVAGDGKIYAVSTEASTSVVAAAPSFEILAVNEIDESFYSSPGVAGGCLLLRTGERLYCIEAEATGG